MSSPIKRTAVPPPRALAQQQEATRMATPANKDYRVSVSLQNVDVSARKEGLLTQGLNRALMAQGMAGGGGMGGLGSIRPPAARRPPSGEGEADEQSNSTPLSPRDSSGEPPKSDGTARGGRVPRSCGGGDARSKYEAHPKPKARQSEKWLHSAERFPEDELETREFIEEMDNDTFTLTVSIPAHMTKKTVLITKGATVADFLEHIAHSCRLPITEVVSSHLILTHAGVHLHPKRKLWSYVLTDRDKVELVKTLPETRYVEVLKEVDGLAASVERVPYFAQTTVEGVCKQMVKKHVQQQRLYGLFTPEETILDESRTLSSFRLESLVYKLKSGKAVRQLAKGSVLLKILLVNASGSKMMKVDRGSKVREAIKRISISTNVEESKLDTYGLFIPLGECLDPEMTFSELKLEDNTTLEYKKCPPHVLQRLVQLREERKAERQKELMTEESTVDLEVELDNEEDLGNEEDLAPEDESHPVESSPADEDVGDKSNPIPSPQETRRSPRQRREAMAPRAQQQRRAQGSRGGRGRGRPPRGRGAGHRGGGCGSSGGSGKARGAGGCDQNGTATVGSAAAAAPAKIPDQAMPRTAPNPTPEAPTLLASLPVAAPLSTQAVVPEAFGNSEADEELLLGPMDSWSVEVVATWLDRLGFHPHICESFTKAGINGEQLSAISAQRLKDELGIDALGIRKAILRKVKGQTVAEMGREETETTGLPKIAKSTATGTTASALVSRPGNSPSAKTGTGGGGGGGRGSGGGGGEGRSGESEEARGSANASKERRAFPTGRPRAEASLKARQDKRTRSEKMPGMKFNKSLVSGDRMSAGSAKLAAAPLLAPSQSFTVESMDVCRLRTGAVKALLDELVKRKGWEHEGIFRISGETEKSSKVFASLKNASPNFTNVDVHDISSALKRYLREMDDPLIPMSCYDLICSCKGEKGVNVPRLKAMLAMLPRSNYKSLKVLMQFCDTVVQHSEVNKMSARNLGIVLGPTCMRVPDDPLKDLSQTGTHVEIFMALIGNFEPIFG